MATIRRTASFRLWQKFTSALPFGPILPSIIPADVYSTIFKSVLICNDMSRGIIPFFFFTHGGRKYNNSEDVHSVTRPFTSAYEHIRRWRQIEGEVLDVSSVIVLDPVDERSPRGGLRLTHCWFGLHNVLATCSILLPIKEKKQKTEADKRCIQFPFKSCRLCVWTCCVMSHLLKCGLDQISWEHVAERQRHTY